MDHRTLFFGSIVVSGALVTAECFEVDKPHAEYNVPASLTVGIGPQGPVSNIASYDLQGVSLPIDLHPQVGYIVVKG